MESPLSLLYILSCTSIEGRSATFEVEALECPHVLFFASRTFLHVAGKNPRAVNVESSPYLRGLMPSSCMWRGHTGQLLTSLTFALTQDDAHVNIQEIVGGFLYEHAENVCARRARCRFNFSEISLLPFFMDEALEAEAADDAEERRFIAGMRSKTFEQGVAYPVEVRVAANQGYGVFQLYELDVASQRGLGELSWIDDLDSPHPIETMELSIYRRSVGTAKPLNQ